jgi:hypothetical protein
MNPEDKDKLNECISILESTDLGLSLVWLWTWDVIKYNMKDEDFVCTVTEDEMWDQLCKAVDEGRGFSLEYGAEQLSDDVRDWMTDNGYLVDPTDVEEEDEEEDEDE